MRRRTCDRRWENATRIPARGHRAPTYRVPQFRLELGVPSTQDQPQGDAVPRVAPIHNCLFLSVSCSAEEIRSDAPAAVTSTICGTHTRRQPVPSKARVRRPRKRGGAGP
jgi:hypothetical protein